ncbi:hypothetical protein LNP07_03215 [Apilactobacillus sp. M161]|uniref:Surface layer protein A domain-containing protein n=1 Tax=Apilactobacillus xinyiensis TaxID=2841032 RepID=A0ABT0I1C0_9LACO|nr:hypothetical protein [Apilactobacillus xinyiensis]MCK8624518.1 hypothetical protein [Apilactobacillus xinyiensis]
MKFKNVILSAGSAVLLSATLALNINASGLPNNKSKYWNQARMVTTNKVVNAQQMQLKKGMITNKKLSSSKLKKNSDLYVRRVGNNNKEWLLFSNSLKQNKTSVWVTKQNDTKWMKKYVQKAPKGGLVSNFSRAKFDTIPSDNFVNAFFPVGSYLGDKDKPILKGGQAISVKKDDSDSKDGNNFYYIMVKGESTKVNMGSGQPTPYNVINVQDKMIVSQNTPEDSQAVLPMNFEIKDGTLWRIMDSNNKLTKNGYSYSSKYQKWFPVTFK